MSTLSLLDGLQTCDTAYFVDDCYFPCFPMFFLELPEHHLVTGTEAFGLRKVSVKQKMSDGEKHSDMEIVGL